MKISEFTGANSMGTFVGMPTMVIGSRLKKRKKDKKYRVKYVADSLLGTARKAKVAVQDSFCKFDAFVPSKK